MNKAFVSCGLRQLRRFEISAHMPRNGQLAGRTTATSRGNEHEVTGDDMVKVRVSQQGSMIGVKTRRYGGEKRRCCTDFFCTILFGMAFGALMVVFFASVRKEPDLIDNLLYPSDSYDQHCGKSGTAVEDYPKALYPRLDRDVHEHFASASFSDYWEMVSFEPTTLCAAACPGALSLSDAAVYGFVC